MYKKGWQKEVNEENPMICWVSSVDPAEKRCLRSIWSVDGHAEYPYLCNYGGWKYATPLEVRSDEDRYWTAQITPSDSTEFLILKKITEIENAILALTKNLDDVSTEDN